MTKSAVRAMDTITAFCSSAAGGQIQVDRFVVGGASKRGWAAWTTAAVDERVVAVPIGYHPPQPIALTNRQHPGVFFVHEAHYSAAAATSSALVAPRVPNGFSGPVVLSRMV